MSPSTRSKRASASSPVRGDGNEPSADDETDGDPPPTRPVGPLEIALEVSRQRTAAWAVFGIIGGALLIWKLGTVGGWVGATLIVVGAFRAWELIQSFRYPPGTIAVTAQQVTLPRGLCLPRPIRITPSEVTAVYFLRRSVPWNRSAPVLIVEIGSRAMAFPRDWFGSEADQRHVVHALMRGQASAASPSPMRKESESAPLGETVTLVDAKHSAWIEMIAGTVLLGVGIAGVALGQGVAANSSWYPVAIGLMVAGPILLWRGFARW